MKVIFLLAAIPAIEFGVAAYPLPQHYRSLTQTGSRSLRYASIGSTLQNEDDINDMLYWTTGTLVADESNLAEKELKKTKDAFENP